MAILAVMFIGKQSDPMFFYSDEDSGSDAPTAEALNKQLAVHCALDIVDERRKKASSSAPAAMDLYFGQLLQVDEYKVFGHYSNTHTKTMVVCDSSTDSSDASVREVVLTLRSLYVNAAQNPFQGLDKQFTSPKFRKLVGQTVSAFNTRAQSR